MNTVFLIIWADSRGGDEMMVRAFSSADKRDAAYDSEYGRTPGLCGYAKVEVEIDGPAWDDR